MSRVGILYICTGLYSIFWEGFYKSFQENFLKDSEKEYFVFTDADAIYAQDNPLVHKIYQKSLGWPDNTMKRFHIFLEHEDMYDSCDYLFFLNANVICVNEVTEQELLPLEDESKGIVVVKQPGFYNKPNTEFTYDRNPECAAYIPMGEGVYYVSGGCNGGRREDYLRAVKWMRDNTDKDIAKGIIALWHDESQLNKYVYTHDDYVVREPSFFYPEGWELPFEEKIRVLDKSKYIPVSKVKQDKLIVRVAKKLRYCLGRCKYYFYVLIGKNKIEK